MCPDHAIIKKPKVQFEICFFYKQGSILIDSSKKAHTQTADSSNYKT